MGFIDPIGIQNICKQGIRKGTGYPLKTKIQLAMELLDLKVIKLLPVQFVTFDSWYPAKELLKHITSKKMHYVCMIKKNRTLKLTEKAGYSRADLICKSFDVTQFRYYERFGFYARGVEAILKDVGPVKLVMVKNGYRASIHKTRFIITDMTDLSAPQMLDFYLNRWTIEVFFRNIKQLLSFENFLYRTTYAIDGHISLVFLAYVILEITRVQKSHKTLGDTKNFLSNISKFYVDNRLYCTYNSQNIQHIIQSSQKKDPIATMIFGEKCL